MWYHRRAATAAASLLIVADDRFATSGNVAEEQGNVAPREMYRTFNCGVGMVLCVAQDEKAAALAHLAGAGHRAWEIGSVAAGDGVVELRP